MVIIYLNTAPESIKSFSHNEKVDVWDIGILTYELVFGNSPFGDTE